MYYSLYAYEEPLYLAQEGDIVLVSYPGSGVHWVQQMVQLILNSGQSALNYAEFMGRTPIMELSGIKQGLDEEVVPSGPRTLRTHFQILRACGVSHSKAKYVYVARNPWDCCVSLYHRIKSSPKPASFAPRTFDDFFKIFVEGKFSFGEYFDHVLCGYDRREDHNVFFVTFEDLKADREAVALKLAYFLGEEYGDALEDREVFANVCEKSSFEYMKEVYGLPVRVPDTSTTTESATASDIRLDGEFCRILRAGKVNDWKGHFTLDHRDRMRERIAEKTRGSNLMSLWKLESKYKCLTVCS
ncbi:hypothetical protein V5799_023582 [Amblyomma americanum]|uniref:Sulfotransferase domain-containing protein n=1 Tax=Amblyomma americanum TaxID=6943 RepID=A0AAQ4FH35_AMBAM